MLFVVRSDGRYLTYCDESDDFDCERWISGGIARID
jgi:hypothetical protein